MRIVWIGGLALLLVVLLVRSLDRPAQTLDPPGAAAAPQTSAGDSGSRRIAAGAGVAAGAGAAATRSVAPDSDANGDVAPEPPGGGPAGEPTPDAVEPLGSEERRALATPVPDGRLEGVVLQGTEPVVGAEVHVWPDDGPYDFEEARGHGLWAIQTDVRGRFGLDVDPAGSYRVEARASGGRRVLARAPSRNRGAQNLLVVLYFGTAEIEGTVVDSAGRPLEGALLQASEIGPPAGGGGRHAHAWTDAAGSYSIRGLYEGKWNVRMYAGGGNTGLRVPQSLALLGPGRTATVDFAVPEPGER